MALNDTIQLRTKNGTIGYRREMSADGKASDVFRPTTTCDACGSVGCDSVPDSVSKRELLERLDRIVEWFAEKTDLEPDEEVMRSTVHELKSEEDFQGRDPEILAEAVEMGV